MISYGVSPELFPRIKFSSKKKAKEQESFTVSKEIKKEAWETLSKKWKTCWVIDDLSHVCIWIEPRWCKITKVWRYCNEKQTGYD